MSFEKEIKSFVDRIADACNPKAIIIFGSVAKGTSDENSDLDIMVILETDMTFYERTLAVRKAIGVTSIPIDILAFTPEEVDAAKGKRRSIISEVLSTGKVVYGVA